MASQTHTVIITGGTRGVGGALVEQFAAGGWRVFFSGRDLQRVEQQMHRQRELGRDVTGYACDLSRKADIDRWVQWMLPQLNRLDVLIHNAGTFIPGKIAEESDDTFEYLMALNAAAPYYLTKRLLPRFLAQREGHIVTISSTAGLQPYPNGASYCISKFAVTGFSKVLREELKPHGIRVTTVYPGPIYTDSWEGVPYAPHRFIRPESMARAIWDICRLPPDVVVEDVILRPQAGDFSESEMP